MADDASAVAARVNATGGTFTVKFCEAGH